MIAADGHVLFEPKRL